MLYKNDESKTQQMGFIAEEVEYDKDIQPHSVQIIHILVQQIQTMKNDQAAIIRRVERLETTHTSTQQLDKKCDMWCCCTS